MNEIKESERKLIIYISFGDVLNFDRVLAEIVEEILRSLRRKLGNQVDFMELYFDGSGRSLIGVPCDGIVVVNIFPATRKLYLNASQVTGNGTRMMGFVPILIINVPSMINRDNPLCLIDVHCDPGQCEVVDFHPVQGPITEFDFSLQIHDFMTSKLTHMR